MVRNIDLVEALIFYGMNSIMVHDDEVESKASFLDGVSSLLEECRRDDTAVIALVENKSIAMPWTKQKQQQQFPWMHVVPMTSPPPNPKDLWIAIHEMIPPIQPKGFGGSSGFGTKAADPERPPLPQHCVVLCHTEDQCRAARYAGMRVVCLTDNALADAVVDDNHWSSLCMDDIATPGSYWLNPPHPRDDDGNAVDVELVIQAYEDAEAAAAAAVRNSVEDENGRSTQPIHVISTRQTALDNDELSDAELAKLLADIDPL